MRNDLSVSSLKDLTEGGFATVIDEIDELPAQQVRRVVACSGKVYFDLLRARRKEGIRDVALVRIEQLYPFPTEAYEAALRAYPNARSSPLPRVRRAHFRFAPASAHPHRRLRSACRAARASQTTPSCTTSA